MDWLVDGVVAWLADWVGVDWVVGGVDGLLAVGVGELAGSCGSFRTGWLIGWVGR